MTEAPTLDKTAKPTQEEMDQMRLRETARRISRHLLGSYAVLGVSSGYMMMVAIEMVFDCLMDIAQRDKGAAEEAINSMARDLVAVMDQLQGWKQNEEAGANGTQAGQ